MGGFNNEYYYRSIFKFRIFEFFLPLLSKTYVMQSYWIKLNFFGVRKWKSVSHSAESCIKSPPNSRYKILRIPWICSKKLFALSQFTLKFHIEKMYWKGYFIYCILNLAKALYLFSLNPHAPVAQKNCGSALTHR